MSHGVSVVVCCYNSKLRLPKTLEALSKQEVASHIGWEVIVVDNNSTDNTGKVAEELWLNLESPVSMRVIDEPTPGLSNARMSGAKASRFEYLIFCDDDNWLFPNYVETVWKYLDHNKEVGVVGGVGQAVSKKTFPTWFEEYKHMFAVGIKGAQKNRNTVYGAGMGLRKCAYLRVFGSIPSFLSDRSAEKLFSGGDDEICFRFRLINYTIEVDKSLKFHHYVSENRLSIKYLHKLSFWMGYSDMYLMPYTYVFNNRDISSLNNLFIKDFIYNLIFLMKTFRKVQIKYFLGRLAMLIKHRNNYSIMTKKNIEIINRIRLNNFGT